MVSPEKFINFLKDNGVDFFVGVPDSLLKDLIAFLEDNIRSENHITSANEGNAVAIAAGYHLATERIAAVYMQNSGLGNAINPLTSLADRKVYSIPMLLIVGWRGEPGVPDEPQHIKQGEITENILRILDIPYEILSIDDAEESVSRKIEHVSKISKKESRPCALLVRIGAFEKYKQLKNAASSIALTREQAIEVVISSIEHDAIVISTTGKISRELYEMRNLDGKKTRMDFLTVGSMGHSSQIALGIAMQKKNRSVYCLDGDGSVIMHMGGLATIGWVLPKNFKHIVLNNMAHESVGGQPSAAEIIDFTGIASSCGYQSAFSVNNKEDLVDKLGRIRAMNGPTLLEIKVNLISRVDLGRPKETPIENKNSFMDFIK